MLRFGRFSYWGALLLLGALCLAPTAARPDTAAARDLYKKGLRTFRAGDLDGAIEIFHASEEADPSYPYPTLALGRIYQELFDQTTRHYAEAAAAYDRLALILRANPPTDREHALYQAYYFQGLLHLQGGHYDRALTALNTFLEVSPDFDRLETVYNAVGIALYYQDQYDKAVASFRRALSIDPDYEEARFNLRSVFTRLATYNEALAIARAGESELAMEKVDRLKEFAPRYLPGRRLEAKLLESLGRKDEALHVYREILGVDGFDPVTYGVRLDMAQILAARGERDAAAALLRENLTRFPEMDDPRLRQQVLEFLARVETGP